MLYMLYTRHIKARAEPKGPTIMVADYPLIALHTMFAAPWHAVRALAILDMHAFMSWHAYAVLASLAVGAWCIADMTAPRGRHAARARRPVTTGGK